VRKRKTEGEFSRRERQIMDALYGLGRGSAADIREALPDPPSYTAVRTMLTILHEKGHVKFESDGTRYIYEPAVPREDVARSAIERILRTFFDNSVEKVVQTLVDREETRVDSEQLDRLARIIEQARREGR
jgi:predicted transcriptional regulator